LLTIRDKKVYLECQKGCVSLARAYDRKKLAKEMLEIIKKITIPKDRVTTRHSTSLQKML